MVTSNWDRNLLARHRYPLSPSHIFTHPHRQPNAHITRGHTNLQSEPYRALRRQEMPNPTRERASLDIYNTKRAERSPAARYSLNSTHLQDGPRTPRNPPHQSSASPTTSHSIQSSRPPPRDDTPHRITTPPLKSSHPSTDPWRIHYCIEKERLSAPTDSKPSALLFYADNPNKFSRESKSTTRKFTNLYHPDHIFGTAAERKVQLRDLRVTFFQIWNRGALLLQWDRQCQDAEGYLALERRELRVQLQRHHVPGTLFVAVEAGDLNINDSSLVAPDVYFRLVDAAGQDFVRSDSCVHDLKATIEIEEGQFEGSITSIDGKEIKFEIAGRQYVCIPGEGMPRDWEGLNRGDLIVEVITR